MSYSAEVKYFLYNKLLGNSVQKKIGYWRKALNFLTFSNILGKKFMLKSDKFLKEKCQKPEHSKHWSGPFCIDCMVEDLRNEPALAKGDCSGSGNRKKIERKGT